ncbi:MAG: hypothetical protein CVV27_04630 [Candidatus Melainabacteria bacterium HGW-Melainabacteria-1]|nr:MAG: hypothetical protein CVV27_04630 [Candidatus Melainabacteria bacterium HGW-Melainabacteria-1]
MISPETPETSAESLVSEPVLSRWDGWMSKALIGVFVLVYFYQIWFNYQAVGFGLRFDKIDTRVMYVLGANFPQAFAQGEYWRVFTSCFLHLDALHLLMNSMALHYFGPMLERSFGPRKLLLAFVLTGVAGSLATTLMHLNTPYLSAGASGGLYGLFGVIFVTGKRYAEFMPPAFQTWLNQTLGMLVIFSFLPFIDMWGHFGGLLAGMLLGLFYRPLPPEPFPDEERPDERPDETMLRE